MTKQELSAELSKWWLEVNCEGFGSDADALATWLLGNFHLVPISVPDGCKCRYSGGMVRHTSNDCALHYVRPTIYLDLDEYQ